MHRPVVRSFAAFILYSLCTALAPQTLFAQQVTRLPLKTADLAYSVATGMIYASIPASATTYPSSIAIIDPARGVVITYLPLGTGTDPNRLALSDTGRFLFVGLDGVGAIRRIDVLGAVPDFQFSLGSDYSGVLRAGDMAVQPGTANVLAVVPASVYGSPQPLCLYEGSVKRAVAGTSTWFDSLVFGDSPSTLYAYNGYSSGYDLCKLRVDAGGLVPVKTVSGMMTGYRVKIQQAAGRIYGSDGAVVDGETLTPVGRMSPLGGISGPRAAALDPGSERVFFADLSSGSTVTVSAYDRRSFLPLWSFNVEKGGDYYDRRALVAWGVSNLAFRSADTVFFIDYSTMPAKRTLRVHKSGAGGGSVTAAAAGISCGTACVGQVAAGTTVTLSVAADAGSTFEGWSGDADCADGTVTVSQDISCIATFTSVASRPSLRRIALRTNDLVWDAGRGVLHASVPGKEPGYGNSVVSINPTTGQIVSSLYVGSEPNRLGLTAAGFLFVGLDGGAAIRRVNPGTGQADAQFQLGIDSYTGPFRAENIAVQPGSDTVVAVARRNMGFSPRHEGVAIYDNGVQRPNATPDHTGSNEIAFGGTPSELFGINNETTEFGYRRMVVDATGVSVTKTVGDVLASFAQQIRYAAGRLYASGGDVLDTTTDQTVGRFADAGTVVAPDLTLGQVFFLKATTSGQTLTAYDAASFLPLWSVDLLNAEPSTPGSLVRWGATGLAFRTDSGVYLLDFTAAIATPRVLRVNRMGTGDGRVTAGPGGIDCGKSCSATFQSTVEVTMVATAATGSTFAGWSGDADCSDGSVTMTASLSCTATFTADGSTPRASIRRLSLPVQDVVFDPASGQLLASTDGGDGVLGNRIVSIDPETGRVTTAVLVGSQPNRLGLSGTGRYLYMGLDGSASMRRLELATGALGAPFSLGNDAYDGPRAAGDIAAQPGNDNVVAVSMRVRNVSPSVAGVAIFRDGVALPTQMVKWDSPYFVEFGSSASVLYASADWGDNTVSKLSIADDGVRVAGTSRSAIDASGADIAFADGRLWASNGQVVDAETLTRSGAFKFDAFPSSFGASSQVAVNPANRLALALIPNFYGRSTYTLAAFDRDNYGLVWAVNVAVEDYSTQIRRLIAWGTNGAAIVTSQPAGLIILDLSALADQRAFSLTRAGGGSGVVALSPGATCESSCLQNLPAGSVVTMTATPSVGSVFSGWSGDADCADGQVTMSTSHLCTANFTYVGTKYVSILKTGMGTGVVTSNPARITCSTTGCSGWYTKGTVITLTATADSASVFGGWTGACTGRSTCTVTLDSDQSTSAAFTTSVRDFSGDGQHDIVWHDRETGEIVFWNMVGGTGPTEVRTAGPADARWRLVGIGDFSGDRRPDLLWRNRVTGENVVWFMKDGRMSGYARVNAVADLNWQVAGVADFDLDGRPDILWHNVTTGETVIWRMYGATYYSYVRLQTIPDPAWTIAAVDDVDGDGNQEILWRNQSTGQNILWQMDRTTLAGYGVFEALDDTQWQVATTGDFNGDGSADIVWRNAATGENLLWWMSAGGHTDSAWLPSMTDPSCYPDHTAGIARDVPGDFNQDGKADLVWRNGTTGENRLWYMDGNARRASRATDSEPETSWRIAGWGDLTGDGHPDIVWRNASTGENRLGPMAATGAPIETVGDQAWQIAAIADFNGDGKADLVWRNGTSGMNLVWLMNGATRIDYKLFPSVSDPTWKIVGAGDFNADFNADLVWRNTATGENIVWFMTGASFAGYARVQALADLNWTVASVADFNGDGRPDLFWRNLATGDTRLWVMDGVSVAGESTGTGEPDLNWTIGSSR